MFDSLINLWRSLKVKLVIISVIAAVIPTIVTGISMYSISMNSIRQISFEFTSKLVKQVTLSIDEYIKQINKIYFSVLLDGDLMDILEKYNNNLNRDISISIEDQRLMAKKLMEKTIIREDIEGIYVFSRNNHAFYDNLSPALDINYDVRKETWYSIMTEKLIDHLIFAEYPKRYLINKGNKVISIVHSIIDYRTNKSIGIIIIDLKLDTIEKMFTSINSGKSLSIFIIDSNNLLVDTNQGPSLQKFADMDAFNFVSMNDNIAKNDTGNYALNWKNKRVFVSFHTSPYTQWKVISFIPIADLTNISQTIKITTLIIVFFSGAIAAIIVTLIVLKTFKPLVSLRDGMKTVRSGDFSVVIEATTNDEIGGLCRNFNSMVSKLDELVNMVYKLEEKNREILLKKTMAELGALQSQINPHFLYNTLESISMMAELNNDHETQKMATALGKLLRLSINRGETSALVSQEIDHVKNYLEIQKIRFNDKFEVMYNIEQKTRKFYIPKLILQPLVENALYHGIETKPGKGQIEISSLIEENELVFYIKDDGIGMTAEKLKEVQDNILISFEDEYFVSRSIGLINVNQRIKLYYMDDNYGIQITSSENTGTSVRINLPITMNKEGENNT